MSEKPCQDGSAQPKEQVVPDVLEEKGQIQYIELTKKLAQLEERISVLEKEKEKLQNEKNGSSNDNNDNDVLKKEITDLKKQNALLENEASKYQSALGVVTNFQLRDDDDNHAVKLNSDISELNDNLKDYVTNLKGNIDVKTDKIENLLSKYECSTIKIRDKKEDRELIKAVLQRHVIELIFSYAEQYFQSTQSTGEDLHLESDIVVGGNNLSKLLDDASRNRDGTDVITRVASTKLRQSFYSVLSNRGFAGICEEDNPAHEHPFITKYKNELNDEMNGLRIIKNDEKKSSCENLAATIIRETIKLFEFRLKVQEPAIDYKWFSFDDKVDKRFMEGNYFDCSDDDDSLHVDLCYFPLIGRDLESEKPKINTPAKVIVRKATQSNPAQ